MQDIIKEANAFLTWLFHKRILNWKNSVETNFTATEAQKIIATVNKAVVKTYGNQKDYTATGAIEMNINQAIEEAFEFILPSHVDAVIDLVKTNGNIIQFGRGKGKLIVLVHLNWIPADAKIDGIDPTSPAHLAKAVAAAGQDVEILTKEVIRLRKELEEKTTKVSNLQDQINNTYRTTWT